VADRPAAFKTLKTAYLKVFEAPGDPAPQVALAAQQLYFKVTVPALYHLGRADAFKAASDNRQGAAIAIVRAVAFKQLGDEAQAVKSYNRAIALDPQAVKRAPKSLQTEVAPMEKMKLDRPVMRELQPR
jgi:DICT domain-containing protein